MDNGTNPYPDRQAIIFTILNSILKILENKLNSLEMDTGTDPDPDRQALDWMLIPIRQNEADPTNRDSDPNPKHCS
jgi:hypothetical protein